MEPVKIIKNFDEYLHLSNLKFEAVAIGGVALNLLGIVSRETKDCDILDPKIPEKILKASIEFSKTQRGVISDWLNNGPDSLKKHLPNGWEKRLTLLFKGKAIIFHTLSRGDLLKTKLYAYCDRQTDFEDCVALRPTRAELLDALSWVQSQDATVDWPKHVETQFKRLTTELGYEL